MPKVFLDGVDQSESILGKDIQLSELLITSQTKGDIIIFDGTNWIRLAVGSDNEILKIATDLPNWEVEAGGVTPKFFFMCNGESDPATINGYIAIGMNSQAAHSTNESINNVDIVPAFEVNRLIMNSIAETLNVNSTIAFRDDGSDIGSVTITGVGEFDSGALTDSVAAGSKCNFHKDASASSSGVITYVCIVECQPV